MKFLDGTEDSVKELRLTSRRLKDQGDDIYSEAIKIDRLVMETCYLNKYFYSVGTGKLCHVTGLTPESYPWLKIKVISLGQDGFKVSDECVSNIKDYDEITRDEFIRIRDEWLAKIKEAAAI